MVILGVALAHQVADAVEAVTAPWVRLIQNRVVLVLVVPAGLVLFVRAARPGLRRGVPAPGAGTALRPAGGGWLARPRPRGERHPVGDHSLGGSAFWRLSLLTWLIFFGLGALVNGVANVFRTADVHEVLPPLVSVALVSVALVWVNLVADLVGGKYGDAPDRVAAFLLWGGPLTVTCLALWELRRLRVRHGLT
ncbi:hypothetical protein ACFQVA_30385 [Actinomadura keratinilytica]